MMSNKTQHALPAGRWDTNPLRGSPPVCFALELWSIGSYE
ncbi:hypothetical protein LX59_01790 [Azomonas agilis]|uniref:Uncharacterized protein n=1 Tax=Azomonas agilis TaxID=116849 RepID=A0A562IKV2_9GAMM|nr:hypothetical protein LX59_01790 [Azomonas agilis]